MEITLEWSGGQRFAATTGTDVRLPLDGDGREGVSPMESLLAALAGCMATDVVDILSKGRQALTDCRVSARGKRSDDPPRRFVDIALIIELTGSDLSRAKAERAVQLSREKYCSVWHTLAPDLDMDVTIELRSASDPSG